MLNRRRFLSILAAAPFLPYEEVLREVMKPKIFALGGLDEAAIQALELESWAKAIPDLVYSSTTLYDRLKETNRVAGARRHFIGLPYRVPILVARSNP